MEGWKNAHITKDDFRLLESGDIVHLKPFSEDLEGAEDITEEAQAFFGEDVTIFETDTVTDVWCFTIEEDTNMNFLPSDIDYIVSSDCLSCNISFEPNVDLNDLY